MQPRILLATTVRWLAAARLAAGFAKTGCTVDAFAPDGAAVTLSHYLARHHSYDVLAPLASLSAAIVAAQPDLIVPCDDRALAHLLSLAERDFSLRLLIARSLGSLESYPALISRSAFIATARNLGLSAAESMAVESEQDLLTALTLFRLPAVLKTDGSWGGDGVRELRSQQQALAAFWRFSLPSSRLRDLARAIKRRDAHFAMDALKPRKPSLSLQRFVAGTPANSAFSCWQGEVLAALHVDVIQAEEGNGPACVVRRVADEDMQRAVEHVARHCRLSGLHGLDFMRDGEGRAHLIESNPRATQTAMLVLEEGRDLLAALVAAATKTEPAIRSVLTDKDTIAMFPQEWRRDPASPWLRDAHHDVPWDDPAVLRAGLEDVPGPIAGPAPARPLQLEPAAFTTWKPSRPSL
jgi:hypothetical protein